MWYISDSDVSVLGNGDYYSVKNVNGKNHICSSLDSDGKDYGGVGNVLICDKDKNEDGIFRISDWITMTEYLNQNTGINLSDINEQLQTIQSSLNGTDGIVTYYYSLNSPFYGVNNDKPRRPWNTTSNTPDDEYNVYNGAECGISEDNTQDAKHNKDVWVHYVESEKTHYTYEFRYSNGVATWEPINSSDNTFTIINKIISTYHLDDVQKALADGTRNIFVGNVQEFLTKTESNGNTGHGLGDIWYFNKSDESNKSITTGSTGSTTTYTITKNDKDGKTVSETIVSGDKSRTFKLNCLYYCKHYTEAGGNHKLSECLDDWINIGDFDSISKDIELINERLDNIGENIDIATTLSNLIGDDEKISPIEKIQIKSLWEKIVGQPGEIDFDTEDGIIEINDGSFDITFFGSSKDALDAVVKNNFVFEIDSSTKDAGYVFDGNDENDKKFVRNDTGNKSNGDNFVINLLNSLYYLNEFLWGTPGIMKPNEYGKLTTTDLNDIKTTIPPYIYTHCGLDGDENKHKKVLSSLFSTYYSAEQAIYTHISGETYNKADDAYKAAHNAGLTAFEAMGDAVNEGATTIEGGLMLTSLIAMGDPKTKKITGGLSGVEDDRVGLFFGSTYEDAFNAANWDSINSKRNELLYKSANGGLSESEENELEILRNIVNNGKPEIPVLITKDGYGSNIGGCYLDDRQMLMVPVDNIDGEVTVSKLTVDKDTRTSKDAEASVSPDSFKIRYGSAFINMGIKDNIPYITGVDGNGNIRFNLGGIEDNIAKLIPVDIIGGSIYLDDVDGSDEYYSGMNGIEDNSLVRCNLPSFKLNKLTDGDLYIDSITYKYKIGNYNRYYEFEVKHVGKNSELSVYDSSEPTTYNVEKIKYFDGIDDGGKSKSEYTTNNEPEELYIVRSIANGGLKVVNYEYKDGNNNVVDEDVLYKNDDGDFVYKNAENNEVEVNKVTDTNSHIFNPDDELYTSVNDVNVYEYVPYRTTSFIFNTDLVSHRGNFPSVDASGKVKENTNTGTNTYLPKSGKELQRILYTNYYPFFGQIELKKNGDNTNTYLYQKETPNTVEGVYDSAEYHKGELSLYAPNTYNTLCKVCQNGNENKMKESISKFYENGILNSMFPMIRDASVEVKVHTNGTEDNPDYKEQTLYYSWEDKVFDAYKCEYNEETENWEWKIIEENPNSDKVVSASISSFNYISKSELDKLKGIYTEFEEGYENPSYNNYIHCAFVNVGAPPMDGSEDPYQTKRYFKTTKYEDTDEYVFETWDADTTYNPAVEPIYVKKTGAYLINKIEEETDIKLNTYNENDEILYPFFTLLFKTYKNGEYKNRLITVTVDFDYAGDNGIHYMMYPHTVNDDGLIVFSDERNRSSSDDFEFTSAINNDTLNINYGDVVQFKFKFNKDIDCGDDLISVYYNADDVVDDNVGLIFKNFNTNTNTYNTFDWNKINDASPLKSTLTVRVGNNVSTSTVTLIKVTD